MKQFTPRLLGLSSLSSCSWRQIILLTKSPAKFTSNDENIKLLLASKVNFSYNAVKKISVSQSYSLLGVKSDCSDEELRVAYLDKVKYYHPDRASPKGNSSKFIMVQDAYKCAMDHRRIQADIQDEKEKADIFEYQHTAPQHRRYLNNEGYGFGSQFNRQKQYQQVKVVRASEAVSEHRISKLGANENEHAMVTKDKAAARRAKMSKMIDRVVDDLIRESMQKGEFDSLRGAGRPLDYSDHNPMVDETTHKINKILVNNGFKPEWISLGKEIRDDIKASRRKLAIARQKLGPPPYSGLKKGQWDKDVKHFQLSVKDVNQQIQKFNMIVPFMEKQMIPYDFKISVDRIVDNPKRFLPENWNSEEEKDEERKKAENPISFFQVSSYQPPVIVDNYKHEKIDWGEVWSDLKGAFKSYKQR